MVSACPPEVPLELGHRGPAYGEGKLGALTGDDRDPPMCLINRTNAKPLKAPNT